MICVKICGITNEEDAIAAVNAGADLIGFVFYPPSPRCVTPARARAILSALGASRAHSRAVGVFVDEPLDTVRAVMDAAGLDLAQLHGQEPVELVAALAPRAYKSIQPRTLQEARERAAHYRAALETSVPAFLVDALPQQLPGGNGALGDWSLARQLAQDYPTLLAGGLTPDNVAQAIAHVRPWGVDVSSGVELKPGLKDHHKVKDFISKAKNDSNRQS